MKRRIKQLSYLVIFILLLTSPFILYSVIKKYSGTCYDNIKNQKEEDVDCGGPCPPCELNQKIVIYPVNYLINPDKKVDIIATIENLNQDLGLKKLRYQFLIYDDQGSLIKTIDKETILFPGEKRYLIELGSSLGENNFNRGKIEIKIWKPKTIEWVKMKSKPINISSYNEKIFLDQNTLKSSLSLYNNSIEYYPRLEVIIFVYTPDRKLLALGKTETSLKPHETKDFILSLGEVNISEELLKSLIPEVIVQKLEE